MKIIAFNLGMPRWWVPNKPLLIVKLVIVLMMTCLMQVSASGVAQTITLSGSGVTLKKLLTEIRLQSGYGFIYTEDLLSSAKPISVNLKNATIEEAMNQILNDQPIKYSIKQKTVILNKRKKSVLEDIEAVFNEVAIRGMVYDERGRPMPGVTVKTKDERRITLTDKDGIFFLKGVDGRAVLVFSAVGYLTQEVNANDAVVLNIRMVLSNTKLDEVQVIAYGETTKRLNTGNVTTVSAKEIAQQPVTNPLLALQGRVPGLVITQANGFAGSGISVAIRGQNSIQSGNDPLYVIDGVPYTSQLVNGLGDILGRSSNQPQPITNTPQNGNPLSFINPADIESISVLKDAGATAIYGSRGANGVILITTKRGKAGETKVDMNVEQGFSSLGRKVKLLNTPEYLQMRKEALKNDGFTADIYNGDYDLLEWDQNKNTDWQEKLLGKTAQYTNVQGNISGGTEFTQFLIGAGYNRQTNIFPGDFADQKASMHFNVSNFSPNRRFKASLTGSYSFDDNLLPQSDFTRVALSLPPNAPDLLNPDGSVNWAPSSTGYSSLFGNNPYAALLQTFQNRTNNLVASSVLSYEILPGLNIRSNFGYTNMQTKQQNTYPLMAQAPESRTYSTNYAIQNTSNISSWIIEPQLTFKKVIGKGTLEALLGSTFQQSNRDGVQIRSDGYSNPANLGAITYASSITSNNFIQSIYKYNAVFARLNFNWADKYLVDLTARRDGTSRFGANNKFHNFGAAGLGWMFSKEDFFTEQMSFLSYGKLRASYGTTGSDQIGDYQYLNLYGSVYTPVPYQGSVGLAPSRLPNPDLQWELTKKFEVALETGFLNDRILFTGGYSDNRSSNQLLGYNLPYLTGFSSIQTNFPATVQNNSWEFSLSTTNLRKKDFSWISNFNLTIPQNKLLAFQNLESSTYAKSLVIGQPTSIRKAFHFEGVDPQLGYYTFTAAQDRFNPDYNTDQNVIVNTLPKFYGGFQNTITYKSFSLDFLFQFAKQTGMSSLYGSDMPGEFGNQLVSVLNRWQPPGANTNIQQFSTDYSKGGKSFYAIGSSDAAYEDLMYAKLRNLSLSWQIKENWAQAMHLKTVRVFVQGQNLWTITKYKGADPEASGSSALPPLRVVTMGLQVSL